MFKQIGSYLLIIRNVPFLNEVRYKRSVAKRLFKKRTTVNPGIQRQSELLNDTFDDPSDVDSLESLESDFMDVGSTYNEHFQQMAILKEQEKRFIVKQKYFKQTYPNFLTWDDKKQIQYLHKTNPDEWTIEKLSDGFPALSETIKKIVKATWTKTSQSKIDNHDNSVRKNWEMLKNGQLNLPPILTKHLHKFTNRNFNQIENKVTVEEKEVVKQIEPITNDEFSEIIRSYERLKNKQTFSENKTQSLRNDKTKRQKKEMYLSSDNIGQTNHTTLGSLKASLRTNITLGKEIEEDEKILLKSSNTDVITRNEPENSIIDLEKVPKTACLSTSTKSEDNKHLIYPEKIRIPKDKLKRGYTYKLYDCYYDSDGLFLYRVPGMEK